MKQRMVMSGFFETVLGTICGLMLICTVAAHVHADNTCLTEFFSEEMEVYANLTDMKLDYQLPQGTKLGDMREAKLKKEGTALEKDFEFILPPGSKPEGNIELKKRLEAQAKTSRKYWLPEGTPVKYVLPGGYTYKAIIPKGTVLTKEPSTHPPQYALAQKIVVEISPPKNSQATLTVGAQRIVERVPGTSGTGTTLQVEPKRAPVGGYITLTVGKGQFEFSKAQFHVCLRIQGKTEPNNHPFIASKDVELKEVQKGKAILRVRIPEIDAGPVDLLLVARVRDEKTTEDAIAEVVSQEFKVSSGRLAIICWISAFVLPWVFAAIVASRRAPKDPGNPKNGLRVDPIWFVSGKYGGASLSLAQILLWTILVFSASFYVLVASGKLLALSDQVLILLGIAGASSVIAKIATSAKDEKGREIAASEENKGEPKVIENPKWLDLIKSEGRPDLYKFQMALFTALAAFFVIGKIYGTFEFPELPAGLLTLMGISNGVYLAAKATSKTVFEKLAETDRELQEARKDYEKRTAELTEAESRLTEREKEKKKAQEDFDPTKNALDKAMQATDVAKQNELKPQLERYTAALKEATENFEKASMNKGYAVNAKNDADSRVKKLKEDLDKLKKEAAETKS